MIDVRDDRDIDLDAFARLRARCAFDAKPRDFLASLLAGSAWIAHAHADGQLVGIARAFTDGVATAYVSTVMVDPDHRLRGIGRALLERIMHGRDGIKFVLHSRPDAIPFYAALGFAPATDMMVRSRATNSRG